MGRIRSLILADGNFPNRFACEPVPMLMETNRDDGGCEGHRFIDYATGLCSMKARKAESEIIKRKLGQPLS